MHQAVGREIVGEIEHRVDQRLVCLDAVARIGLPAGPRLDDEAALGADRDDDRVLHRLRLHQVENFGAEIVGPIAEADSAARDVPGAQMTALHPRTVHMNFVERRGIGQAGDLRALELQRDVRIGRRRRAEIIGAHRRLDQREQRARRRDRRRYFRSQPIRARYAWRSAAMFLARRDFRMTAARRITRTAILASAWIIQQHALQSEPRRRQPHLKRRDQVRAQQRDLAPREPRAQRQRVQRVVRRQAAAHRRKRVRHHRRHREIRRTGRSPGPRTVNKLAGTRARLCRRSSDVARGVLGQHVHAEVMQRRHQIGQHRRLAQSDYPDPARAAGVVRPLLLRPRPRKLRPLASSASTASMSPTARVTSTAAR